MNELVPDIPPPVLDEYYPGQVNRLVTAEYEGGKTLQFVWLPIPNDNIYALPPLDKAEDARYVVNRLFVGSKNVSDTNATAGSYDNRVFYHEDLMPIDVGRDTIIHLGSYAPLRLASSEFVPIGVRVVYVSHLDCTPQY